jgi:PmbA protein
MELAERADGVEQLLKREQLDGYEILISQSRDLTVEAKGGKLDAFRCAEPLGVAIRVQRGEGLGFSFSTNFEARALARMVEGAVVAAGTQSPNPCNVLPPAFASYPDLPGICDESIQSVPEEEKVGRALELERLVLAADPRVKRVRKSSYSESLSRTLIRNSHGLDAGYAESAVSCSVSAVAEAEGDAQMGWDFGFSHGFDGLDLATVAGRAARNATSLLGARIIPTMRCQAVFNNHVAADILELVADSFLAENVVKGKSLFGHRVGERIFPDLVTVRDDGLLEGGMGTAPCDGEGVPQQNTLLVAQGVLQGFLYDSHWGKRLGMPSTGNAVRSSIKNSPRLASHNLFLEPGAAKLETLVSGVGKGVLITNVLGMHTANRISGDFSVGAAGFYIEGGEIRHPVKGIAISGNLLELLAGIDMIADDLRFFGAVGSPAFRVAELAVSGS